MNGLMRVLAAGIALLLSGQVLAQKGKPVVAIYEIDDLARSGQAATFSAMIETAIESTNKFRVIERQNMGKLVGEQARAKAGLVTTNTPGKMGGFEGADFLVYGTITTVSSVQKTDIGGSLLGGMLSGQRNNNVHCANTLATLGVDIKITDARSGEVKYVTRISDTQKSASVCNGAAQVDVAALMRSAADKVATGLVTAIYPIQIAAVQGDGVIVLNYGEGAIAPDAVMAVFTKGEVIRDPATGDIIANNESKLGYIRITDVGNRISKAVAASPFSTPPQVGAIVRPVSVAELQALNKPQKRR